MVGLLDLPVEVLETIAYHAMGDSKIWSKQDGTCMTELNMRLVHPHFTPSIMRALFQDSKVVLNPRDAAAVAHLLSFLTTVGGINVRHLTSIQIRAHNFLQRTHRLNEKISILLAQCTALVNLELSLDGHFVQLADFAPMHNLKRLSVQGESVYANMGMLSYLAPQLEYLELLAPCVSGPPAFPGPLQAAASIAHGLAPNPTIPLTSNYKCNSLPSTLKHVHIANLNTPAGQTLLQNLPFRPISFSYTLIHNYDLLDLVLLLCKDDFCERLETLSLTSTSFVAPSRLQEFKSSMYANMLGRLVKVFWSTTRKEIII